MWTWTLDSKCGALIYFIYFSFVINCIFARCLKVLLHAAELLLLQSFCPIKWSDCVGLTHKLKAFSTQLTTPTPTVTLRVLLRCFFERFSSLSCCHDNCRWMLATYPSGASAKAEMVEIILLLWEYCCRNHITLFSGLSFLDWIDIRGDIFSANAQSDVHRGV